MMWYESVSRGRDDTHIKKERFEKELEYLQNNWKAYTDHDRAYNVNLTLRHENFSIKEEIYDSLILCLERI
jgi:ribosome-associated toxin RatA of RatAB toxin-antitoxin module